MKKILLILLAAVMVFSLAACSGNGNNGGNGNAPGSNAPSGGNGGASSTPAEGYDAEFTVIIGYGDDWTPFPGKNGVTFANSDNSVLAVKDNGSKVEFTGLIAGDSVITATLDGAESKALVHVRAVEGKEPTAGKITYHYDAPTNFYYEFVSYSKGKSYDEANVRLEAYLGGARTTRDGGILYHYAAGVPYVNDGGWKTDYEGATEEMAIEAVEKIKAEPWPLNAYYSLVVSTTPGANLDINDYYKGNETVCGISCWVVDLGLFSGENYKFWINPANGHTLKMESGDANNQVTEVLSYDPDFKVWPDGLKP